MEFPEDFKNKNYEKGSLLIANPVLPDPNFSRTVILLCDHDEQGSFGLVINRSTQLKAPDLFLNISILKSYNEKVYLGGPVSQSMVFFLCRSPSAAGKLDEVCSGVYLGSNLETLESLYASLKNPEQDIRFYLGYSGWSSGQLAEEMEQNSWLVQKANEQFIFLDSESLIWPKAVNSLGEKYQYLTKAPVNPQWN
jgi:putative transcriptional regulator